jgi:hypothetical protein
MLLGVEFYREVAPYGAARWASIRVLVEMCVRKRRFGFLHLSASIFLTASGAAHVGYDRNGPLSEKWSQKDKDNVFSVDPTP